MDWPAAYKSVWWSGVSSVAGWPGGRVAEWRVAGWPGGRVAGWPGKPAQQKKSK